VETECSFPRFLGEIVGQSSSSDSMIPNNISNNNRRFDETGTVLIMRSFPRKVFTSFLSSLTREIVETILARAKRSNRDETSGYDDR